MDDHQTGSSKRKRSGLEVPEPTPSTNANTVSSTDAMSSLSNTISKSEDTITPPTKEALYEEAKARKIASLTNRAAFLSSEIASTRQQISLQKPLLRDPDAAATVKTHIRLLHQYNEMRDVGQGLLGMIADNRGVRIAELYESGEFGVGRRD